MLLPLAGEGLPVGLQFLARPFDEPTLIGLAHSYEQLTQHRRPPPLFPECRGPLADGGPVPVTPAG